MLSAIWQYRGFVFSSVGREFELRYKNSLLGASWAILNPLAMIFVYTVIFSQIMHARLEGVRGDFAYSVYLCSGLLTWGLFSDVVIRCMNIFLDNSNYLKKINFPRICLPLVALLSALINFGIIFSLFVIFIIFNHLWPGLASLSIIPVLVIEILLAVGLGLTLGIVNVFFRDVGQFFGIFMQFWFWFTPIVYPVNIIPESFRILINLNPMYHVINAYQTIIVNQEFPDCTHLIYPGFIGVVLCVLAFKLFHSLSGEMVDEL